MNSIYLKAIIVVIKNTYGLHHLLLSCPHPQCKNEESLTLLGTG